MLLLLSYPVSRLQVLLGKFLGHLAVLTFATAFAPTVGAFVASGTSSPGGAGIVVGVRALVGVSSAVKLDKHWDFVADASLALLKDPVAWQAASQTFIGGWNLRGEVDDDPYLARAYPDWPALLAGGERARDWAERLYLPLLHATLSPKECL